MSKRRFTIICLFSVLTLSLVWGQERKASDSQQGTSTMGNMQDMSDMKDMPGMDNGSDADTSGAGHAIHSMEGHHMDMGPHMKMTALRDLKPGDERRAERILEIARQTAEKYQDYQIALKDGYQIFLPNVPQKQYHFTNNWYAIAAAFGFNPEHPTSLLYEKRGDDYKLIGVMYTAPKRMTEDDLDKRIPLSVAQWHEHVNFCAPPPDKKQEMWGPIPNSVWPAPSPPKTIATLPAESLRPSSSAGWCTSIRLRRTPRTSGQ